MIFRSPFHELVGDVGGQGRRWTKDLRHSNGSRYLEFSHPGASTALTQLARTRAVKWLTRKYWDEVREVFVNEVKFLDALDHFVTKVEGGRSITLQTRAALDSAILRFYEHQGITREAEAQEVAAEPSSAREAEDRRYAAQEAEEAKMRAMTLRERVQYRASLRRVSENG